MPDPSREFEDACDRADIPVEHREALWHLVSNWPGPAAETARITATIADYGHWRLFQQSRLGDDDSARRFEAHWKGAARSFLGRGFTHEQVEEFAALFFTRVYERASAFAWASPFQAYLRTILLNLARDEVRRLRRRRAREVAATSDEAGPAAEAPDPAPSAEAILLEGERRAALTRALAQLAPVDRQILVQFADGVAGEALARMLGIGKVALYQRLRRARVRLKGFYDDEMSGGGG